MRVSIPATRVRYIPIALCLIPMKSHCFNSRNAGKIHLPKIKSKQIFKIGFNSRGAGKIHLQKQRKHTVSMHLSLCKPPVLLLYYSTHVVFCLRSAQNLPGGTAFFCRGPARTPFFCRQKPGRKTEVRAKGQAVCSRKAFCSSPKPLLLPSGSLPHRLRAEPPPRGGREEKNDIFLFSF